MYVFYVALHRIVGTSMSAHAGKDIQKNPDFTLERYKAADFDPANIVSQQYLLQHANPKSILQRQANVIRHALVPCIQKRNKNCLMLVPSTSNPLQYEKNSNATRYVPQMEILPFPTTQQLIFLKICNVMKCPISLQLTSQQVELPAQLIQLAECMPEFDMDDSSPVDTMMLSPQVLFYKQNCIILQIPQTNQSLHFSCKMSFEELGSMITCSWQMCIQ